ncbi:hypothetical protein BDM02DRAFT_1433757 [Thelephora ganbajun]|uniref:Uncharacterized protein n=1 Tax=Thelephora ganbajun TaxID=370292 RepID=A0ACB6ZKX3_THEGA|nr:hypothetical protein BDM02DRAFT_1433757 [Thelephora ganbajun]
MWYKKHFLLPPHTIPPLSVMSATIDPLEDCIWSVEAHRFDNIAVKCVFKCRNPGYKTYSKLHKHYLDVHKICLHRVARLDPDNEDDFRRQITSFFVPITRGQVTSQESWRGYTPSRVNQPQAVGLSPQTAGPSRLRGYQAPFRSTHANLGQDSLSNSPSWYAIPIPTANPHRNHSAGLRPPVWSEVSPFRSPAVYPTTRHQPYPQPRPRQQGSHAGHSSVCGQGRGKGRGIYSTAINRGLQTQNTPSQGNCLEPIIPTARPYDGILVELPRHASTDPRYSPSRQAVTEISIPAQWTPAQRYPTDTMVSGNFRRPATAQEHISPVNHTRKSEGVTPVSPIRSTQLQRQQLQAIVTGSCGPATYLPTPPMGTNSLPDGSPRCPLPEPERSPRQINQKRRSKLLTPPIAGTPSRYATQQLVSHPYLRPANGSTTSQLAQQVCENRQREELMPVTRSATPRAAAITLQAQAKQRASREVNDVQRIGESSATWRGSGLSEPRGSVRTQKSSQPAVSGPGERPQTASESTPPVLMVQESNQEPAPTQRRNSDKCHPTKAVGEEGDASREEGSAQDLFSGISWEGWGLIKTCDGIYLPETFGPFPHPFEDLTDQL